MDRTHRLHALLIGIDAYAPPADAGRATTYPHLRGCVADARRMAQFLVCDLGVRQDRVRLLTASQNTDAGPDLPTYDRIVGEFAALLARTKPGDSVWIHYSGHGGRTPTQYPEFKGQGAFDEALVPPDIALTDSQYLRDVELGFLLDRLVRHGLFVTLVLDCCHSGGLLRDVQPKIAGAMARSNRVERWQRTRPSTVATVAQLAETWHRSGAPWRDHGSYGYVLIAACREHEQAWEYPTEGSDHGGALTRALLESIQEEGIGRTYRQLFERILGRVRTRLEGFQTPRLEGEGDRLLLGSDHGSSLRGLTVLAVEPGRILVATGHAQGVAKGDRFFVEPLIAEPRNQTMTSEGPAVVELLEPGSAESWGVWVRRGARPVSPGDRAVPARFLSSQHRVVLDETLGAFSDQLRAIDSPFLSWERVPPGSIRMKRVGEELRISGDSWPLTHVVPSLSLKNADPTTAVRLLERVARYCTVERLNAEAQGSSLTSALTIRVGVLKSSFRPHVDPVDPVADLMEDAAVPFGTWLAITIENRGRQPLEIAVLALDPRWSVTQLYPSRDSFLTLNPNASARLPLRTGPPAGIHRLKVFATLDAVRWHWLELPAGTLPGPPRDRPRTANERWVLDLLYPGRGGGSDRSDQAAVEWTVQDLLVQIDPAGF
ncbi:MAG: caspase family protein [Thermoanaerobaculia bacterium]|nr:caspase family protein [Thermoanaerobaculia bacterium]